MSFLRKMFGKDDLPVVDNQSFWVWFEKNEKYFFEVAEAHDEVNDKFIQKVMSNLELLNCQFYCLAGMYDKTTAELIVTPEGDVKTIVLAEELMEAAPALEGWRFTALKPATGFNDISIEMDGYKFDSDTISFYSNVRPDYPDEIEIILVHKDYNEMDESIIKNGCIIYLDNALGELNSVTLIDSLEIRGAAPAGTELISMLKLNDFLEWRQKEFLEKYEGVRYNTENDSYCSMETQDGDGLPVLAILNEQLLEWDSKASHPWMMVVKIKYDGKNNNGMPDNDVYELMNEFEDKLIQKLPDQEGYLNVGRETYNSTRSIYFACKEFRKSSKSTHTLIEEYLEKLDISYEIYKDKYWMTMNKFQ